MNNPGRLQAGGRILVMTSVAVESAAVLRGLRGDKEFDVLLAGVGPVAAAVNTAKALAVAGYRLVVSAGIGGGFPSRAEVGSLALADEIVAADLGVDTPAGFRSLAELGFGPNRISVDEALVKKVREALGKASLLVRTGPVLTVSTVTGTAEKACELAARVPGAIAEAMEGYGVAFAAQDRGVPVLEIRAISNLIGPRDRALWRIKEALGVLEAAFSVLLEV
ncbi:MAG: Futalosine hydrolase [Pelotomaculum sp. PtaB.Bin104]|nr:MAG: Futalosine hydrolase [Pelotomaculum sp. PtaB.Bin104]